MNKYVFDKNKVHLHNIVYAITSPEDYQMQRLLLLTDMPDTNADYVLVEGSHCSCYNFDETEWEAFDYTAEELVKLLRSVDEFCDPLRVKLKNFLKYYDSYFKKAFEKKGE